MMMHSYALKIALNSEKAFSKEAHKLYTRGKFATARALTVK